jgi:biopolymer transport protein ExbB/TolQ
MIELFLTKIMLTISNALLIPDMLLLLIFMALTVTYLGGLMAEAKGRWKHGVAWQKFVQGLKNEPQRRIRVNDIPSAYGFAAEVFPRVAPESREKWIDDLHLAMESALSRLHLGIRLGPILGLAGALIPLGPALVALSSGNIPAASQHLIVAFTTTVVGLFIGGLSYVMHSIRQRWYMQDLNDAEFIIKRLE